MRQSPYTIAVLNQLGIDRDQVTALANEQGDATPIGQCAATIATTIWNMEAAERAAKTNVASLTEQAQKQAAALATGQAAFNADWLTAYAERAAEADATLKLGVETLRTFNHMLGLLLAQATAA